MLVRIKHIHVHVLMPSAYAVFGFAAVPTPRRSAHGPSHTFMTCREPIGAQPNDLAFLLEGSLMFCIVHDVGPCMRSSRHAHLHRQGKSASAGERAQRPRKERSPGRCFPRHDANHATQRGPTSRFSHHASGQRRSSRRALSTCAGHIASAEAHPATLNHCHATSFSSLRRPH